MIFTFFDERATDKTAVGGKAAVLAQLTQQGYPVPDGFVIAAEAFGEDGLAVGLENGRYQPSQQAAQRQ